MKRRLVKQGENAITVTLPSKWIKDNNLVPKDEVDIVEEDGNLVVSADTKKIKKKVSITLKSSNQKYIDALFRNFYINGYDEIHTSFTSKEDFFKIINTIEPLIGYEIESKKDNSCLVKNISDSEQTDYESIFKKIFYIIFTMQELTEKLINGKHDDYDLKQIEQLNKDSSKFACFCRRVIFKTNLLKNEEALTKYTIINSLHMIARNYYNLYVNILDDKISASKDDITYFSNVTIYFKELFNSYNKNDLNLVNDVMARRKILIKEGIKTASKGNNYYLLHNLMESVRLIGTITGKIGFISALEKK